MTLRVATRRYDLSRLFLAAFAATRVAQSLALPALMQQLLRAEPTPTEVASARQRALLVMAYRPPACTRQLWRSAHLHVFGDGGANAMYQYDKSLIPDLIAGDMDSVEYDVLDYYRSKGAKIVESEDQDSTDLDKCLAELPKLSSEIAEVVAVGVLGGNVSQEFSALHSMVKSHASSTALTSAPRSRTARRAHDRDSIPLAFVSDDNVLLMIGADDDEAIATSSNGHNNASRDNDHTRLRRTTRTELHLSPMGFNVHCALIPLGSAVRVSTSGLRWNLQNSPLQFGRLVSTSNEVAQSVVTIDSDGPLLFALDTRMNNARR